SISPADFAAWRDQDWFDLRGGPELMVFHNILMDRWQREDPEGLLTWALANRNGAANQLAKEWAANDPQRLLAYFKLHPNPATEIEMLANVAAGAPDLALQRLVELVAAGLPVDALESSGELLEALAGKS